MGFQITDRTGIDAGLLESATDDIGLGRGVGNGVPIGFGPVIHRAALDHSVNMITVGNGTGQRLEQDRADALAWHIAISALAKGLAAACRWREICPALDRRICSGGWRH